MAAGVLNDTNTAEAQESNDTNENDNIEDPLEQKRQRFMTGVVVWAKVDGYPMWPAVIRARSHVKSALKEDERKGLPPAQPNTRVVEFFNDENNVAVVDINNMDLFTSDVHHLSRTGSALRTIISEACDEAETFIRACGLPFQREAISDGNDINRPKDNANIVSLGGASESESSGGEDLDMPLAVVYSGKTAPGAPIPGARAQMSSELTVPSRPKTRSNSDMNEDAVNAIHGGTPLTRAAALSNNPASPQPEVNEEDVIGPTPEGHPPWTTPLSVLSRTSPRANGAQPDMPAPETALNKTKLKSLPMKLRLRSGDSPEKSVVTGKRRRVSLTSGSDRRSREHVRRSIVDDDDEEEEDDNDNDNDNDEYRSSDEMPSNGGRRRLRENGDNAMEIDGLNRNKRPRHGERQIEMEGFQGDVKFLNEQAGTVSEFATRLTRLTTNYENLFEAMSKLQVREAELKVSHEEAEKNVREKKQAAEAQSKHLDQLTWAIEKRRKEEKKVMEEIGRQKAKLEQYKAQVETCAKNLEKEKESVRKWAEEAKLQKELADNHRAEADEVKVAHQKMQRRMKELQDEVVKLRDERRGLRKLKRMSGGIRSAPPMVSVPPPASQSSQPGQSMVIDVDMQQVVELEGQVAPQSLTMKRGTDNREMVKTSGSVEKKSSDVGNTTSTNARPETREKQQKVTMRKEVIEAWGTRVGGASKEEGDNTKKKG